MVPLMSLLSNKIPIKLGSAISAIVIPEKVQIMVVSAKEAIKNPMQ